MTIEVAVADHVASQIEGSRVYQQILPQTATLPAIRVQRIDGGADYHLRGENNLRRARVQLDACAEAASGEDAYHEASALADAIETVLSGTRFTAGGSPPEVQIVASYLESRRQMYEAEERRISRVMLDFTVHYRFL
jgi:hypothetical protein